MQLQEKLNEDLASNESEKAAANVNTKPDKIKFKNLVDSKKDVVIRKLLKTIDLMNQEMSKCLNF